MGNREVIVKYSPGLDALYIWFVPKQKSKIVPQDAGYFFVYQSQDELKEVRGYEWLDFSYFVDEDGTVDMPIPEPRSLFNVQGTDLKGATLKEVVFWAYQKFVRKDQKHQLYQRGINSD